MGNIKMPHECLHLIEDTQKELSEASGLMAYEDENKKSVLASLILKEIKESKTKLSFSMAETKARASDEWQRYLGEYREVKTNYDRIKGRAKYLDAELSAWQTECKNATNEWRATKHM